MILQKNDVYPILTYKNFEHQMGMPEKQFKDPLAVLMDSFGSMRKGENIWYQILVYPIDVNILEEEGKREISRILKEKSSSSSGGMLGSFFGEISSIFSGVLYEITGQSFGGSAVKEDKKDEPLKMMNLKPKEKKQVEAIQQKVSKQIFDTKIRFIYVAKKEVMNKPKATMGFIGFMKQFLDVDLNGLKPDMSVTITTAHYLFVDWRKAERKSKLMYAYKRRSGTRGRKRFKLNTEELATIWHVPIEAVVRAPLIQKSPGRKSEPPMSLPLTDETVDEGIFGATAKGGEDIFGEDNVEGESEKTSSVEPAQAYSNSQSINFDLKEEKKKGEPPANLPFV